MNGNSQNNDRLSLNSLQQTLNALGNEQRLIFIPTIVSENVFNYPEPSLSLIGHGAERKTPANDPHTCVRSVKLGHLFNSLEQHKAQSVDFNVATDCLTSIEDRRSITSAVDKQCYIQYKEDNVLHCDGTHKHNGKNTVPDNKNIISAGGHIEYGAECPHFITDVENKTTNFASLLQDDRKTDARNVDIVFNLSESGSFFVHSLDEMETDSCSSDLDNKILIKDNLCYNGYERPLYTSTPIPHANTSSIEESVDNTESKNNDRCVDELKLERGTASLQEKQRGKIKTFAEFNKKKTPRSIQPWREVHMQHRNRTTDIDVSDKNNEIQTRLRTMASINGDFDLQHDQTSKRHVWNGFDHIEDPYILLDSDQPVFTSSNTRKRSSKREVEHAKRIDCHAPEDTTQVHDNITERKVKEEISSASRQCYEVDVTSKDWSRTINKLVTDNEKKSMPDYKESVTLNHCLRKNQLKRKIYQMENDDNTEDSACMTSHQKDHRAEKQSKMSYRKINGDQTSRSRDSSQVVSCDETTGRRNNTNAKKQYLCKENTRSHTSRKQANESHQDCCGKLIWAQLGRGPWWPGIVVTPMQCGQRDPTPGSVWVFWFGDHRVSQVKLEKALSFCVGFPKYFKLNGKKSILAAREAIKVQAERSGICTEHWSPGRLEKWAFEGFIPKSETVSFKIPEWVWKALHQIRKASQAAEVADTSNEDDEEEDSDSYAQQFRIEMVAKQEPRNIGNQTSPGRVSSNLSSSQLVSHNRKDRKRIHTYAKKQDIYNKRTRSHATRTQTNDKDEDCCGELIWAQLGRGPWWPGIVVTPMQCGQRDPTPGSVWVFWFGDHRVSQVKLEKALSFCDGFPKYVKLINGKKSIMAAREAIKVQAERCGICTEHWSPERLEKWAFEGFIPISETVSNKIPEWVWKALHQIRKASETAEVTDTSNEDDGEEDSNSEAQPFRIEMVAKQVKKVDMVRNGTLNLEDICIACGDEDIARVHPYFVGGLCRTCMDEMMDTMFTVGNDGINLFCVICANGGELFVCENTGCQKVFCSGCIELLVKEGASRGVKEADNWQCYLCMQFEPCSHGLLSPRQNWPDEVFSMYNQDCLVNQMLPEKMASRNKPIRVLSLFDGIGTGRLVLEELGFQVDAYFASEIDEDALMITKVRQGGSIIQLGDVTSLRAKELQSICPIDLLIGGSPCNDLSVCNPERKGLFEGTGKLFFEFTRVKNELLLHNGEHHLFWLYENVAVLPGQIKTDISRHLGCEPAKWDAQHFSAQKRSRYFWGNIPGMYCPSAYRGVQSPELSLGKMLMPTRTTLVAKARTVTTNSNSLRHGRGHSVRPINMGDQSDTLWIPELERIFGFPDHYTDVGNLGITRRQKLLGRSWSVPVIKHLLGPLKTFFPLGSHVEDKSPPGDV